MNPDAFIVHIDDEQWRDEKLKEELEQHLHVPPEHVLWKPSVAGSLALFTHLAETRKQVAAVVCNGEIKWEDADEPHKELAKNGGLVTFARYQDLQKDGRPVRELIGTPPWIHHTNSLYMQSIIAAWNDSSPDRDLHGGVWKGFNDNRIVPAALAIAMSMRGLPPDDPLVQWAVEQIQEDCTHGRDDRKLKIDFPPWVHEHMRARLHEGWPEMDK